MQTRIMFLTTHDQALNDTQELIDWLSKMEVNACPEPAITIDEYFVCGSILIDHSAKDGSTETVQKITTKLRRAQILISTQTGLKLS